jgi:hypothetical protein
MQKPGHKYWGETLGHSVPKLSTRLAVGGFQAVLALRRRLRVIPKPPVRRLGLLLAESPGWRAPVHMAGAKKWPRENEARSDEDRISSR